MCVFCLLIVQIAEANNVIKACGHHDYAPWNWLKGDKIVGLCADIATELYRRIGYEVDHSYVGPWTRCQHGVSSGDIDINICSFKNSHRTSYSVFMSQPIAVNENALFVKSKSDIKFERIEDLAGLNVGKVRGVSFGNKIDDYLATETNLVTVETYPRLFKMLLLGRVDAFIFGRESGQYYLAKMSLTEQVVDLPKPVVRGDLYISLSKQSPHMATIDEINKVFLRDDYQAWQAELFKKYHRRYFENAGLEKTLAVKE